MSKRKKCTKERPYNPKKDTGRWSHPDVEEKGQEDGYPSGDIVYYECPYCGINFKSELPQ